MVFEPVYLLLGNLGVLISVQKTLVLLVRGVKARFRYVFLTPLLWRKAFSYEVKARAVEVYYV